MRMICSAFLVLALAGDTAGAAGWPQFRGPEGNGHASPSSQPPVHWNASSNVVWKTPIHDRGWSSPVILNGQVWLTTASEDGRELYVIAVDLETGAVCHDRKVFDVPDPQFCHKFNSYASPTPVLEGDRVYVTFGSPGTACLDTRTGEVLWERRDFVCNHFRGAGSSPILYEELLILHFDGSDQQYVAALDKRTGRTVWRTDRSVDFQDLTPEGEPEAEGDFRKAFATPHVIRVDGEPQLISLGAKAAYSYVPRTGKELWKVVERGQHSAATRPVYGSGLVFYPTGFARGQVFAVRPDGRGDVTGSHVEWRVRRSVPNKPSLLHVDGLLFMVDDGGIASCLDAKTGDYLWNERVGGNYSASPLYAAGRVYMFNEEGKTTVLKAAPTFEVVAVNELPDGFMASPAVADNALVLRSKTHLYRIETR